MSFPRYPTYKPSGVEWLGEVPEHWSIIRLKNVLQCRITDGPHTTPEFIDEGVPFLSVDGIQDGELRFDGCRFISEKDHEEFSRKAQPVRDDILMGKAASTGKIARVKTDFTFSIWSPLALIRVDSQLSSPSFYEQALKSAISQAQIDVLCTSNTQKNISMDDIPRLVMTRPTIEEQLAIATFLDHETAKIDALIAEQQRLIELLQEKRQAVISHAVTKGLNPHAPMKDSGVEWLGEVPEHWVVGKLSYYAVVSTGATPDRQRSDYWGGDIPWIKTGEVRYEDIQQAEECITELALKETSCDLLQPGTLLMALYGQGVTRGRVGLLAIPASCNQACAAIKPFLVLSARFLELYFVNAYTHIRSLGNETTQQNLNLDYVRGLEVLLPPQEEQNLIWRSCGERIKGIDSLLGCSFDAIALLQERRSALISAAVTGQIDVRGLVPEAVAA